MNTRQDVEGYLVAASSKPRWEDQSYVQGIRLGGNAPGSKAVAASKRVFYLKSEGSVLGKWFGHIFLRVAESWKEERWGSCPPLGLSCPSKDGLY